MIRWLRERAGRSRRAPIGIGDDAALLDLTKDGGTLVTTDTLVEGVHFPSGRLSSYRIGWKALAVNLSDIAAMGGRPTLAFLTLALPPSKGMPFLQNFWRGWQVLAKLYRVKLVGGDMVSSPNPLMVSVTLLGELEGREPITRRGARVGDEIWVTGSLGGSLEGKHAAFFPRVREGLILGRHCKVHAMIDISDGLLGDLGRILEESRVGAELYEAAIPASSSAVRRARKTGHSSIFHALYDGEDYELLFTLSPAEARRKLPQRLSPTRATRIGTIIKEGLFLCSPEGKRRGIEPRGYDHFRGR